MIGDYGAEDKPTNGRLVEDEHPQKIPVFPMAYSLMEDNKLNSQIHNNEYIHIKNTRNNADAGNCGERKRAQDRKSKIILLTSAPRAESSVRAKQLAEHFGAEVRFSISVRSSTPPAINGETAGSAMHLAAITSRPPILHANPAPTTLRKMAGATFAGIFAGVAAEAAMQARERATPTAEIIDMTAEPVPTSDRPADDEPVKW
jgi:hypothetical protein